MLMGKASTVNEKKQDTTTKQQNDGPSFADVLKKLGSKPSSSSKNDNKTQNANIVDTKVSIVLNADNDNS